MGQEGVVTVAWTDFVERCATTSMAASRFILSIVKPMHQPRYKLGMQVFVCFFSALEGLIPACSSDECEIGDSYCQGLNIMNCEQDDCSDPSCMLSFSSGNYWSVEETCEHACVDINPPTCTISAKPDPRCSADGMSSYCKGTEAVNCLGGYVIGVDQCGETNRVCIPYNGRFAACAISATPDPDCQALSYPDKLCRVHELVTCDWDYVTSVQTCCAACVSLREGYAFCAAANQPDPRCAAGAEHGRLECPGGAPAMCNVDGYLECMDTINSDDASTADGGCPAARDE